MHTAYQLQLYQLPVLYQLRQSRCQSASTNLRPADVRQLVEMVSKPKNAVGDRHLARKSMHLARNLEFGRSHQMSVVACSNASSAECNISVYFFPVPSTRCAHHACSNLIYSCFHSNIHALGVFLGCISWIRVGYST